MAVRALAADPLSSAVYSCALDHKVFKWSDDGPIWKIVLHVSGHYAKESHYAAPYTSELFMAELLAATALAHKPMSVALRSNRLIFHAEFVVINIYAINRKSRSPSPAIREGKL